MKQFCLLIAFFLGALASTWAQSESCYATFYNRGIDKYNELQFDVAIANFKAAIVCSDRPDDLGDVTDWLEKAQNGFFDEIQRQKARVEEALLIAEREKIAADSARLIADANLFGLQSRNALEIGQDTSALILSYSALKKVAGMEPPSSLNTAFGQASHEFFSQTKSTAQAPIFSILALSDPSALVIESGKGEISLLLLETMEYRMIGRHNNYLTNLQYTPKQKKLLSTDIDGNIKVWDFNTAQSKDYPAHQKEVTAAAFAPDNGMFLTVSKDQSSKLWDLSGELKEQLPTEKGVPYDIQVASAGHFLVRNMGGGVAVYNATSKSFNSLSKLKGFIYDAQFSAKGNLILTASGDKTARVWNLEGDELLVLSHQSAVRSAVFSPREDMMLTRTKDDIVSLWNKDGQLVQKLNTRQGGITFASFSPSGNFIVTGAKDNTIKVWNTKGLLLHTLMHETTPIGATFSPDEQLILSTATGSSSKLWDQTGNLLRTILLRATNSIPSIFSADGQYILSVIDDETVNVCPVPKYAKDILEQKNLINSESIERVEKEYNVKLKALWN